MAINSPIYGINQNYITYPSTWTTSATTHTHSISPTYPGWTQVEFEKYQTKEQTMSTLDKVRAERKEARERKRIEQAYEDFDALGLADSPPGTVVTFVWVTPKQDYTYAALFVDGRWFVTGRESPNGLGTEDFVAWLIGKEIEPGGLTFLGVDGE